MLTKYRDYYHIDRGYNYGLVIYFNHIVELRTKTNCYNFNSKSDLLILDNININDIIYIKDFMICESEVYLDNCKLHNEKNYALNIGDSIQYYIQDKEYTKEEFYKQVRKQKIKNIM